MKNLNKTLIAAALVVGSTTAFAESAIELSANVALSTEYVWRGISQSDEEFAISGGIDAAHESGLYLGVWAANVDFQEDFTVLDEAQSEVDIYGGFGGDIGDSGVSFDIGFIYYAYPGAADSLDYDFWEFGGGLGYTFGGDFSPSVGASVYYSDDTFGGSGDSLYVSGTLDLSLPNDFGLGASVGNYDFDGGGDYTDWRVYLSKEVMGFGLEIAYTDTDVDACSICDGRAIFTISKSM